MSDRGYRVARHVLIKALCNVCLHVSVYVCAAVIVMSSSGGESCVESQKLIVCEGRGIRQGKKQISSPNTIHGPFT
jgi:hypothetical protein